MIMTLFTVTPIKSLFTKIIPLRFFSTSTCRYGLEEFFPPGVLNEDKYVEENPSVGRRWKASELRIRSNTDLHKFWYILLKERNMLLTMRQECKRLGITVPAHTRYHKVKVTMDLVKQVIKERESAILQLEKERRYSFDADENQELTDFVREMMDCSVINFDRWIKENEENLKPPICNGILAKKYLMMMLVGGPNVREDYHIEHGEEFFFMLRGDMLLKIMEKGEPKDIHIKEGEIFVLPARIPHSPQRNADTLGLVIERDRSNKLDCIRYYCEDRKTILWNKYFHLNYIVKDLVPVVNEFFSSEEYKTNVPKPGLTSTDQKDKIELSNATVDAPFKLDDWINKHIKEISSGFKVLFDKGEFKVLICGNKYHQRLTHETWFWMKCGKSTLDINGSPTVLEVADSILIPQNNEVCLNMSSGYGIIISMHGCN